MRNFLLATTAAAAVGIFAGAANAQITVTLGGYTEFFAAVFDDDVTANNTGREFQIETEIVVKADGKADNGLLYGTKVELQNSGVGTAPNNTPTGIITDEASVYLGGAWGRLELGDFDGASDTLVITAPYVGVGQIDGDYTDFLGSAPTGGYYGVDSSDSTKVMYLTPRFAGFQAGVSFATENGSEAQNVVTSETATGYKDFWEFGANYVGEFSDVGVKLGATGSTATANSLNGARAVEDFFAWYAGAQLSYAGFAFGGGYGDNDQANITNTANARAFGDQEVWNIGASFTTGPLAIGASYVNNQGVKGSTFSDYQAYGVGGVYTLAPGMLIQSDLMFVDEESRTLAAGPTGAKTSNDAYVWLISTRLNF
jgi:outer membrane protein OmpU